MSGQLELVWLDVFSDRPFGGNPLAVIPHADSLDAAQMQRIAFELGLSETAFVLEGTRRLRIFTPKTELPFAGHPIVGQGDEVERPSTIRVEVEGQPGAPERVRVAGDAVVIFAGDVQRMVTVPCSRL